LKAENFIRVRDLTRKTTFKFVLEIQTASKVILYRVRKTRNSQGFKSNEKFTKFLEQEFI
jgi:hypothetical protein